MTTSRICTMAAQPSRWAKIVETQDGAVLLDIDQGICFSITPVGALIWRHLNAGESPERIMECLAHSFPEVSRLQIGEDVLQFIRKLDDNNLLREDPSSSRSHVGVPALLARFMPVHRQFTDHDTSSTAPKCLFWKAMCGLILFDFFRLYANFSRLHSCVQNWPAARPSVSLDIVNRVCRAINQACGWYPKRVRCLQRSCVTTCLLRNCGIQAEMVFGAQKFPFKAHAWTEVSGRPINERRDVQSIYLIWERC